MRIVLLVCGFVLAGASVAAAQELLVEAESFEKHGGWKLDTQFIELMGSPYLLAHGLGEPVEDATTQVELPATGRYRIWVRTKNWVAKFDAPGAPGKFKLLLNGRPLETTFGTKGKQWHWQDGGVAELRQKNVELALRDLTGFDGRVDAIYFTQNLQQTPPNENTILPQWRRQRLGLPATPETKGPYDLVVIGGGYAGTCTAISAARLGCTVALIQNRPVLGGNGSGEVRVSAEGRTNVGKYPRLGDIVEELADNSRNARPAETFEDEKRERLVRAEPNIDLFFNHHAYDVEKDGDRILAVYALDTRTSRRKRFIGKLFADCTGHGTIGYEAGADYQMSEKGHMGMSNMWAWQRFEGEHPFPKTPWALDLEMGDFPYPQGGTGGWFWESGFNKHPIKELESMRDHNLRAVFGAWNAMKNKGGADKHKDAKLVWVAYIGGPRESRRLLGDVILSKEDILEEKNYDDGFVPTTWSIDLHYPREEYAKKYPDDPFISRAVFEARHLRNNPYHVPYRCLYSRNVDNLFMAGRDISVTREALGTVRVMKTGGMMGEVVGKAASVAVKHDCSPRMVYTDHLEELRELVKLPGSARRSSVHDQPKVP